MSREKLLTDLNFKAKSIKAHINILKMNQLDIHMLDIDMLKKKTIELYDLVFELERLIDKKSKNKISDSQKQSQVVEPTFVEAPIIEETIKTDETVHKQVVEDVIVEERVVPEIVESVPPVIEQEPVLEIEPEAKNISEPIVTTPPVEEKTEESKKSIDLEIIEEEGSSPISIEPAQPTQTTYDLFSDNSEHVVAEKYHAKDEQSIADKMQKTQITNIREAIGINEKFLFINELFNGDLGRYNKILDDINQLPTKKGVETYLLELKIQFQWADDSEAYIKLKELLDRKFN